MNVAFSSPLPLLSCLPQGAAREDMAAVPSVLPGQPKPALGCNCPCKRLICTCNYPMCSHSHSPSGLQEKLHQACSQEPGPLLGFPGWI